MLILSTKFVTLDFSHILYLKDTLMVHTMKAFEFQISHISGHVSGPQGSNVAEILHDILHTTA